MGFAPLSNGAASLPFPFHQPRSGLPTASPGIRRGLHPCPLSSTSSPAFAFPRCRHRFGPEPLARIAFRPRRFARPRRFSPPIARILTWLLVTVRSDEGLSGLLHPDANHRVRCVSSASPGGASPSGVVIADGVPCWSLGRVDPRIEVRTPRRVPLTRSRDASPRSLPPRTLRILSIRDLPERVRFRLRPGCRIERASSLEALLRW